MLSSKQEVDQRIYALSFMMGESRGSEVLKMIISSSELVSLYGCLGEQWPCIARVLDFGIKG